MPKKITIINPVRKDIILRNQPKKRVCAYCRVSTASADQLSSFVSQINYYTDLIQRNKEWEFAGIYADAAKTGTSILKRSEFNRMLEDCELGRIDMIITKSVSRFARNSVDSIQAIRKLKELGISVYFEEQRINTLSEKSELLLIILSSMAQRESENISSHVRWSVIERFQKGEYIGPPPTGYKRDQNGNLIIDEAKAPLIKRIFQEYLNGNGCNTIAQKLNEERVPTIRYSETWDKRTITYIINNITVYKGDLLLQKTYTPDAIPFKGHKNYGQLPQYYIRDDHEPIITEEQANNIKRIADYRKRRIKKEEDGSKFLNRYAFSGVILCGECGGVFGRRIRTQSNQTSISWACNNRIMHMGCNNISIKDDKIKLAFTIMWNKLTSNNTDILMPILEYLKKIKNREIYTEELIECNNKIIELCKQNYLLSKVHEDGYIESAIVIEKKNALTTELEMIKEKRNQILDNNRYKQEIKHTEALMKITGKNQIIEEYNENLFLQIVDKIIINNHDITFRLTNGLELPTALDTEGGIECQHI